MIFRLLDASAAEEFSHLMAEKLLKWWKITVPVVKLRCLVKAPRPPDMDKLDNCLYHRPDGPE